MKKIITTANLRVIPIYFITILTLQYVNAQTMGGTAERENDLTALSKLNAEFIENFISQDTVAHNKIIHRDFICIQGSGVVVGRDQYMKDWANGYKTSGYETFEYVDEHIRIFGDMALVKSRTNYTRTKGETTKGSSVYTDTYIKENGRWWCVQAQITPIK
jgi:ketosteroid isomerase-like protein